MDPLASNNKSHKSKFFPQASLEEQQSIDIRQCSVPLMVSLSEKELHTRDGTSEKEVENQDEVLDISPVHIITAENENSNHNHNVLDKILEKTSKFKYDNQSMLNNEIKLSTKTLMQRAKLRSILTDKVDEQVAELDFSSQDTASLISTKGVKYTPLESQFLKVKQENPDCLLMIEVGYKFRFFGQDAKIASKELNIVAFLDHSMYTASVPTYRLMIYIKKLVKLGYKVGVVKQMETAALKANGDNKNALFERKLANIYTRSTLLDDINDEVHGDPNGNLSNYLLCINLDLKDKKDSPRISIVAVELSTGEIIYDDFTDNPAYTELETRLAHIPFTEILLSWGNNDSSKSFDLDKDRKLKVEGTIENIISIYCEKQNISDNNIIRIERKPELFLNDSVTASKKICLFYENNIDKIRNISGNDENIEIIMKKINELPNSIIISISALIEYLEQFKLNIVMLPSNFRTFTSKSKMLLNSDTLQSLELFVNQTNGNKDGTLFATLDNTKTKFGKRKLRKWLALPLLNMEDIINRQNAIKTIYSPPTTYLAELFDSLKFCFSKMPDLERLLSKSYYGRCSPFELNRTIYSLQKLATLFQNIPIDIHDYLPKLLSDSINALSKLNDKLLPFNDKIDYSVARNNQLIGLLKNESEYPEIVKARTEIEESEKVFKTYLIDLQLEYGNAIIGPYLSEYKAVSGEEYLLEIPIRFNSKVPNTWIKISSTKAVSRYRSPRIIENLKRLLCGRELLEIASKNAFKQFQENFSSNYSFFHLIIDIIANLDCYLSLSELMKNSYYVFPTFIDTVDDEACIHLKNSRNVIIESILGPNEYVPNDIKLDNTVGRSLLITGPNMGGKSSYIRQIALTIIMAQIGSPVPANEAELSLFDAVFTRMGTSDDIAKGQSTFMRELHETSRIMSCATSKSLVILDELGRGTSTHDGTAIAYASLLHFVKNIKSVTLFVTHYPILGEVVDQLDEEIKDKKLLRNCHMQFLRTDNNETNDEPEEIIFLYKAIDGLSTKSFGLNVARMAGLPSEIIKNAKTAGNLLKDITEARRINQLISKVNQFKSLYKSE